MSITKFLNLSPKNMQAEQKIDFYITAFLKYLTQHDFSAHTIQEKERHLIVFEKWLLLNKITDLESMTEKNIKDYKDFLHNKISKKTKTKISPTTRKSYLRTIAQFLQFLKKYKIDCPSPELIDKLPCEESDVQKLINYYFQTKGISTEELKANAKKKKIIYARYTKPAKDLLQLADSLQKAKAAINKVAQWAKSRNLDYAIETVLKKWPEIHSLEPKKKTKQPFYKNDRMVKSRDKWYVINKHGEWLEFAGDEEEIEWREQN